jgi:hypothetical protein
MPVHRIGVTTAEILSRFSGEASASLFYLPDLTLWYDWHQSKGTLPDRWKQYSLPQVARALDVPVWWAARPWRVESSGVKLFTTQQNGERVLRSETLTGTLVARWTLGPDGAWWQTEYPVKTRDDLVAALELVNSRSYILDSAELDRLEAMVGDDGVLAIEIPRRPYSDLLHELLGWGEGLVLLNEPAIQEIIAILETKLQRLVQEVVGLSGHITLSPDNLDGQFISPAVFRTYLAGSYRRTAEVLHQYGKYLLVHVGGPIKHLLAPLAEVGVDGVEGVAGPPQGDVSLAQAREIVGRRVTLWGGIPQDFLLDMHDRQEFEATVIQAVQEARGDSRMILGVADRVPVDADLSRLEAIPALVERALSG